MGTAIVWLRQDLRLRDNPALYHAVKKGEVIPLYILDDGDSKWSMGAASRWWLHHSLDSLGKSFKKHGLELIIRSGNPQKILQEVLKDTKADSIFWNRCYEPNSINRDKKIEKELSEKGVEVKTFNASLLFEPWEVEKKDGGWFKVYTPFWKSCLNMNSPSEPLPEAKLSKYKIKVKSEKLDDWNLLPKNPDWSGGFYKTWNPGEEGAIERLTKFLDGPLQNYSNGRDMPGIENTSKLSPHLHFGEISPRQIWHSSYFQLDANDNPNARKNLNKFLAEVGWREFSYHLLYHFPEFPDTAFRPEFRDFPWEENKKHIKAWQKGKTGYPMVDAGMRELWHTGSMHNRVRMITASFLTKHLLIPWQEGAKWFWDTLVDADLANNSAGWQWVAGCGADAAPYFRIFNPVLQGKKFDPDGDYVRKWIPELKDLDNKYIHSPWECSTLPANYPTPIIEHNFARNRALKAYETIKKSRT